MTQSSSHLILEWWRGALGDRTSGRARALAADLRRATEIEALTHPQIHDLSRRLGLTDGTRLAMMARLLAEVRDHHPAPLFTRLGPSSTDADDGKMSKLRFQKLLRSEGDALTDGLRRAIRMADRACNNARSFRII